MSRKKTVLIITYYWPPAGGSGVQRHLIFAKYLRLFGWEPIIFTVKNGEYPELDSSLLSEVPEGIKVLKAVTIEPYALFRMLTGNRQTVGANLFHGKRKKSTTSKFLFWIRSNLFIPDARIFWALPSIFSLRRFLRHNSVDAIISTGPPHTTHIIARSISRSFKIPWLADFRDAWTKIDYFEKLNLSRIAKRIHQRWEQKILTSAHGIVTVSPYHAGELQKLAGRHVSVVTNGFDEDHFPDSRVMLDEKFTILHTGMLSEARNHSIFWEALSELSEANRDFREHLEIRFYGTTDASVLESVPPVLTDRTFFHDYVDHAKIPGLLRRARILYLPIHNCSVDVGFLPGKLFEYLGARRPVVSIGPATGDTAVLLEKLKAGQTFEYHQKESLKDCIRAHFQAFENNTSNFVSSNLDTFTRRNLTQQLAMLLDELLLQNINSR